jgi:hypothetical protein
MKFFIGLLLIVYANTAVSKKDRCVKWTWYKVNYTQQVVCLKWEKR